MYLVKSCDSFYSIEDITQQATIEPESTLDGFFTEYHYDDYRKTFIFGIYYKDKKGLSNPIYKATYGYEFVVDNDELENSIDSEKEIRFVNLEHTWYNNGKIYNSTATLAKNILHKIKTSCMDSGVECDNLQSHLFTEEDSIWLQLFKVLIQLKYLHINDSKVKHFENIRVILDKNSSVTMENYFPDIEVYFVPKHLNDKDSILSFMKEKTPQFTPIRLVLSGEFNWKITTDTFIQMLKSRG